MSGGGGTGTQTKAEIERELDLMYKAGIGGVEINTIAFPGGDTLGCPALPVAQRSVARHGANRDRRVPQTRYGSRYHRRVGLALRSGVPHARPQQLQMLTIETIDLKGGERFTIDRDEILRRVNPKIHSVYGDSQKELLYLRLMPKKIDAISPKESVTIR